MSTLNYNGLSNDQVVKSRQENGSNNLKLKDDRVLLQVVKEVATEPMFILLLAACIIYFIVGQYREGVIMLIAIFIVAGISLFQEYRSKNAVKALKKLSAANATVLRNGKQQKIPTEEVVVGDTLLLAEGEVVAADGVLLVANDLSLNESIVTGESFAVTKNADGAQRHAGGKRRRNGAGYCRWATIKFRKNWRFPTGNHYCKNSAANSDKVFCTQHGMDRCHCFPAGSWF